jgi:hypothetical protein
VAQVPASSKIELVTRRKERISSPPPQISWGQKVEKNFVLSGEVNVNQRQDGNGATGTTPRSLSQVPPGCNGTVKVFATFVCPSVTSGNPDFRYSHVGTVCDLLEATLRAWLWFYNHFIVLRLQRLQRAFRLESFELVAPSRWLVLVLNREIILFVFGLQAPEERP